MRLRLDSRLRALNVISRRCTRTCHRGLRGFAKNFDAPRPAHLHRRLARVRVRIDMWEILDDLLERPGATPL
jgi:hypothetical protein